MSGGGVAASAFAILVQAQSPHHSIAVALPRGAWRNSSVTQAARHYNVPPMMLADLMLGAAWCSAYTTACNLSQVLQSILSPMFLLHSVNLTRLFKSTTSR